MPDKLQIGIDLGGSKIAGLALDFSGATRAEWRIPTPRNDYDGTIRTIAEMLQVLQNDVGGDSRYTVGIAMPGSISPSTGCVQNANSVWLNGKRFHHDVAEALGQPVRTANDADCFALSEATDGAAADAKSVFGVILGTGCGGGLVYDGRLLSGPRRIAGEWGHNGLPRASAHELPGPQCWCGRRGCLETWLSGPGLAADHARVTGTTCDAMAIARQANAGDAEARATLDRHTERLARGLAMVINIFDPDVVVLGGGLSQLGHLYADLPQRIAPHIFADHADIAIRPPHWGDASGVRGACRLWATANNLER